MFSDVNDVYDECINYPVISSKILDKLPISVPKYLIYCLYVVQGLQHLTVAFQTISTGLINVYLANFRQFLKSMDMRQSF